MFKKAERKGRYIKLAITGSTGSGKTFSALRLAKGLAGKGGRIAVADTENGSASLYSDKFDFDVSDIEAPFKPAKFTNVIAGAVKAGYDVLIVDSASHFWKGILEMKDQLDSRGGNSYTNWSKVQADYERAINSFLQSPIHVIACMRSKMAYVLEENEKGKQVPKKVGLQAVMRDDVEYEFTTVFDVGQNHFATTTKDRTGLFTDDYFQINEETGEKIAKWLDGNVEDERQANFDPDSDPQTEVGPESEPEAGHNTEKAKDLGKFAELEYCRTYLLDLAKDLPDKRKKTINKLIPTWTHDEILGHIKTLTKELKAVA